MMPCARLTPRSARPAEEGGFTLIEAVVTLGLLAFLLSVGVQSFSTWVANAKVRAAAESLTNGIRQAQAEAVRRNRTTVFMLTNSLPSATSTPNSPGRNWAIQAPARQTIAGDTLVFIQGSDPVPATSPVSATLTAAAGATAICFDSNGRLSPSAPTGYGNAACALDATQVQFNISATSGSDRALRALVSVAGQVHLCDPKRAFSSATPDGCP